MIYIIATVFIIVCVASLCYNKGARTQHHDSRHDSFYAISQRERKDKV